MIKENHMHVEIPLKPWPTALNGPSSWKLKRWVDKRLNILMK